MWIFFALASALTAAMVAIFGKLGLKSLDTTTATTIRVLVMTVFLLIFSFSLGKWRGFTLSTLSSRDWLYIILFGVAGALSWLFYFAALKYGPVSKVVAIDRISLVFAIILASLFLGEVFGWKAIVGAVLMVVGAIVVSM